MAAPIAFICAMPMELTPLVKRLRLTKTSVNGVDVRSGTMGDRDVVAVVTGMGTALATEGTEQAQLVLHDVHYATGPYDAAQGAEVAVLVVR